MAVRILGIDPGLRTTGWGVIAVEGTRLSFVACGCVTSSEKLPLAERLRALHEGLQRVVAAHAPEEVAVEETFVNRDPQSALKLGHARAIALVVPALAGLAVAAYAANLVKKTVVGAGHADKGQVQAMVKVLLPKAAPESEDAADALAVAITHAHHRGARAIAGEATYRGRRGERIARFAVNPSRGRESAKGPAMINASEIREHMEVIGSDGRHIGTVDHCEGDEIKLTKSDPASGGEHHFIPLDMVSSVDVAVKLSQPAEEVKASWH